ncbi:hypothetical protein [Gluconobacter japonicus]|uniref:hypothetical protein n=1 Tax=Gluconobacter japonicus TaxID=376620 RepID=UPI001B8AEA10|nr:hypothetical protein [Gluconobacter japonicus]MBS1051590.1 hypothetical protein [Gluconobacter japonicus]
MSDKISYEHFFCFIKEFKEEERKTGNRHLLDFHFYNITNIALSISKAISDINNREDGIKSQLIQNFLDIKYKEELSSNEKTRRFEQLVQLISEVIVLQCVCNIDWPSGSTFEYEPKAPNGKRPEFKVETDNTIYLFEVKAPSLIDHKTKRTNNSFQMPYRHHSEILKDFKELYGSVTLPKDNPIKDFLLSAQDKFSSFSKEKEVISILVVVWDSHMYEATAPLVNQFNGLLTENSWFGIEKIKDVDGVIVVNKMDHIINDLMSQHVTGNPRNIEIKQGDMPNVFAANARGKKVPEFIISAFNSFDASHIKPEDWIVADYAPLDMVMWIQMPQIKKVNPEKLSNKIQIPYKQNLMITTNLRPPLS